MVPNRVAQALFGIGKLVLAGAIAGALIAAVVFPAVGGVSIAARNGAQHFKDLPSELETPPLPQRSRILAADGSILATFYAENRVNIPLNRVAPIMRKALVAIEDSRFYQHGAIDLKGTMRALVANSQAGEVTQGGSTLTQQYVKNVLVEQADTEKEIEQAQAPTVTRKLQELRYALSVEERLTKNEILERYFNIAYFGDGAYGIEAASRHYFSRPASKLSPRQAALLAGIVRSPYSYDPTQYPKAAKKRRNIVLNRMADLGQISANKAKKISERKLGLDLNETPNGCDGTRAPYFCAYVINEIKNDPAFGKTRTQRTNLLLQGGLTIKTTVGLRAQRSATEAVRSYVPPDDQTAAAEAMVEPGTGKIRALAVSKPYGSGKGETRINLAADFAHGGNRGTHAGSTFKAFTLAAALAKGMPFGTTFHAPDEITVDGYTSCEGAPFRPYKVGNAADGEAGTYNLMTGTWHSVNTFFVQLEKRAGLCNSVQMARKLGMKTATGKPIPDYPSFTLGASDVAPVRLAAAFAGFAARGRYCEPVAITGVVGRSGKKLQVPKANCRQVMRKEVADGVNYILQGVLTKGTAAGNDIGRAAAGKTGTTNDYTAAWFAGYTPGLSSAVALADPRGGRAHPLENVCIGGSCFEEVFGASIPAPIWAASMRGALAGMPASDFVRPPGSMFRGLPTQVPDVVGLSPEEAVAKLEEAGFSTKVERRRMISLVPEGQVAATEPPAGAKAPRGSLVTVVVNKGFVIPGPGPKPPKEWPPSPSPEPPGNGPPPPPEEEGENP